MQIYILKALDETIYYFQPLPNYIAKATCLYMTLVFSNFVLCQPLAFSDVLMTCGTDKWS